MPVFFYCPLPLSVDDRPKYRPPGRPRRDRSQINARRRAARRHR